MDNSVIVNINSLERKVDGTTILKGVSAQVKPGKVIALLGKNGAGKITLSETLLGFAFPTDGNAKLWDVDATQIRDQQKQKIGFVPQQDDLLVTMTGKEIVELFIGFRARLIRKWQCINFVRVG